MRRRARIAVLAAAAACLALAVLSVAAGGQTGTPPAPGPAAAGSDTALAAQGRRLFVQGCSTCHGTDLRGRRGLGPSLRGVGAAAADFYLSTGRMPLDNPTDQPVRNDPAYPPRQIAALVAYVGSFGGPPVPAADSARGSVRSGLKIFMDRCAGCHQALARGGIVTGGAVPALDRNTDRQLAEAVRVGPYLMPKFSDKQVDGRALDDLAAYVKYARDPQDSGGWGIGHIGPIPEGMVAWLLAAFALVGVARLIGEREPS